VRNELLLMQCYMLLKLIDMKVKLKENLQLPSHIFDRLDAVLSESNKAENIVPYVFGEFKISELEKVTQILLETIQELQHYQATTKGLYATDRPDLVKDKDNVLFRIR
jgi:peptidyl-tRNA hydrolase